MLVAQWGSSFGGVPGQPIVAKTKADRWRDVDGCLSNEALTAELFVGEPSDGEQSIQAQEWYKAAADLSVVKLVGSWAGNDPAERRLKLAKLPEPAEDAELEAIAEALRRPVVVVSDVLGDLKLNRPARWFGAETTWQGLDIEVYLDAATDDKPDATQLATAEAFWASIDTWCPAYMERAVEDLLDLKNSEWLGDDKPVTAEEFASRIAPMTLSFTEGKADMAFTDGNLFFGHWITVCGTPNDGPQSSHLSG